MKRARNSTTRSATKRAIRFIQRERRQAGQALFDNITPPQPVVKEESDVAPVDPPDLPDM